MLHGCEIDDHSLIGIGAVVLNRVKIGKNCIVGANALVTEGMEIPDNSMVLGSPAKIVKQIDDATAEFLKLNGQVYVDNLSRFNEQLEAID